MAKISVILLLTVFTVPSVLMSKVSNQTQKLHSTVNNDLALTTTDCPGSSDNDKRNQFLQYFIGNQMPSGLFNLVDPNVLYLCQTHPPSNPVRSYYSTIFDKTTMNAVLSAYVVTHESALLIGENSERKDYWTSKHGDLFLKTHYDNLYREGTNAAHYQKGHLLPFSIYSFDKNYGQSTFDYSNAVPQRAEWNQGVWKSFEKAIKRYTQLTCGCRYRGTMYLLTGTSQFAYHISKSKLEQEPEFYRPNKKITYTIPVTRSIKIPNVMWTAGCCIGFDPQNGQEKVESIAVIGNNLPSHTLTKAIRVRQLQLVLADPQAQNPVILFPGRPACSEPGNSYIVKVKSK